MNTSEWTSRSRPVRVDLDATATRPPGRGQTWTVEAGHWRAGGASEKTAAEALATGLRTWLAVYQPPAVLTYAGHVAVIAVDMQCDGGLAWLQKTVSPDGRVSHSSGSAADWDTAKAHARYALAQRVTDWHDDASVWRAAEYLGQSGPRFADTQYGPRELLRYAAWQRAAKTAMDAGREDWHEWAYAHRDDFTIQPATEPAAQPAPTDAWGSALATLDT